MIVTNLNFDITIKSLNWPHPANNFKRGKTFDKRGKTFDNSNFNFLFNHVIKLFHHFGHMTSRFCYQFIFVYGF